MGDDLGTLPAGALDQLDVGAIEPRNAVMVRLGALLALNPSPSSLQRVARDAQHVGVGPDEIVRCLVVLVPTLGIGRISSVASDLGLAIGFDLDAALEQLHPVE
jgi:hypothetical protein